MKLSFVYFGWSFACLACILALILSRLSKQSAFVCIKDFTLNGQKICRPACAPGSQTFSLPGMDTCHKWLECKDFEHLTRREPFFQGVVKKMFKTHWNDYDILISEAVSIDMQPDFENHVEMLKLFSPSPFVVQALGFCKKRQVLTEYHKLGSALNIQSLPSDVKVRFGLCISYVRILVYLHNHQSGTRLMCDSSSLAKTLTQYLLTDDLNLVVSDLDALPVVDPSRGAVCGHRELEGDLVAPEQRWTLGHPFNKTLVTPYNEKSDVWKIPDVCNWILSDSDEADVLRFHLFSVHRSCKDLDPKSRPTSQHVLEQYQKIYSELQKQ